jgi:hypothetical protein
MAAGPDEALPDDRIRGDQTQRERLAQFPLGRLKRDVWLLGARTIVGVAIVPRATKHLASWCILSPAYA